MEGKTDRSLAGTGCSPRMAVLDALGQMAEGDVYRACSVIGTGSCLESPARLGWAAGRFQSFRARAWITGVNQYMLDPAIHGREAIGYRIRGRVLGRQFERFARIARLS